MLSYYRKRKHIHAEVRSGTSVLTNSTVVYGGGFPEPGNQVQWPGWLLVIAARRRGTLSQSLDYLSQTRLFKDHHHIAGILLSVALNNCQTNI